MTAQPLTTEARERIIAVLKALLAERGPHKTICPSEIARELGAGSDAEASQQWRAWMPVVRTVAGELAAADVIVVTQGGEPVDIRSVRGPVRIGRPSAATKASN
ncbi:hypothetical protein SADO_16008 [Salinisphaera dokdonensis CL-ES53]|uniref:DUF3253 domain-containing protein n=1 Tax=Salinisphaera dokdonensis CL-ES53 TaxID=1304272 RepID=A0ABV2B4H9_9GAMM